MEDNGGEKKKMIGPESSSYRLTAIVSNPHAGGFCCCYHQQPLDMSSLPPWKREEKTSPVLMHRNGFCCVYSIITLTSCRHNGHSPAPLKRRQIKWNVGEKKRRETLDFTTNPSGRILSFSIIKHFNGFASFLWRDPTLKGSHGIAFVEVFSIRLGWMMKR